MRALHLVESRPISPSMHISVGPVASSAARAWASHLLGNLQQVQRSPESLPFRFPADVARAFRALLLEWLAIAETQDAFRWSVDIDPETARVLVQYWANLDSLSDKHLAEIGMEWSPRQAWPFFVALARGVDAAFRANGESNPYAQLLAERAARIESELAS